MKNVEFIKENQIQLSNLLKKHNILKDNNQPFSVSLSPYFITESRFKQLARESELILSCVEKIVSNYLTNSYIHNFYYEFNHIDNLIKSNPPYTPKIQIARIDFAEDLDGNFKIMEINCSQPGGAVLIPLIKELYETLEFFKEIKENYDLVALPMDDSLFFLKYLLKMYKTFFSKDCRTIGFAYSDFCPIKTDMHHLIGQCKVLGIDGTIFNVKDLRIVENNVLVNNKQIDLIHHKFDFFTDPLGNCRPCFYEHNSNEVDMYLEALKKDSSVFVNPISSMTIGESKKNLSLLKDPKIHSLFSPEERSAIMKLCPETHTLDKYHSSNMKKFLENKNNYVLKHAYSTRGKGIFMGHIMNSLEWKTKLKSSNVYPSVVQEYINHKAENIWAPLEPIQQEYRSNLAVYLINGKASGLLCRATQGYHSNFYTGGICRPAYVVKNL